MLHNVCVISRRSELLFNVGDPDEAMYVVESGLISITTENDQDKHMELKRVKNGEAVVSLLSFLDHLGGKRECYKTVTAKAVQDTRVIRFSFDSFRKAFEKHPECLSRAVQVAMIRLHRVTLLALHHYLGLGAELMSQNPRGVVNGKLSKVIQGHHFINMSQLNEWPPSEHFDSLLYFTLYKSNQRLFAEEEKAKNKRKISAMNESELRKHSKDTFKKLLGLTDEDLMDEANRESFLDDLSIVTFGENEVIVEEESSERNWLLVVLSGAVQVSQKEGSFHKAFPGGLLGQLQVLTAEPSFFTYTSVGGQSKVAVLDGNVVRRHCLDKFPHSALKLAMSVIDNLSHSVRSMDFALEWSLVESGKALYKQDAMADSVYVILSGRLRSVIKRPHHNKKEIVGEFGRGELTGIVETLMKTARSTSVIAVRDTEVAKLPSGLIDYIKTKYPAVLMRLIKLLGTVSAGFNEFGFNESSRFNEPGF